MIIDTHKRVITYQLRKMVTLLLFAISIIVVLLVGRMPNTFLGLNKYHWSIVLLVVFVLSVVIESLFKFHYIYYSDEKEKIVLRFFSLGYLNRMKRSIEIPKSELLSYNYLVSSKFSRKLELFRIKNKTEAKYPPVSLTLLKKKEVEQILKSLDGFKKQ